MGIGVGSSQNMYAADIATINAATLYTTDSEIVYMAPYTKQVAVQLKATGHGAGAGVVTATLLASIDGSNFEAVGIPIVLTIVAGAIAYSNVILLDVGPVCALKVTSVNNGDAAQAITAVNVKLTAY